MSGRIDYEYMYTGLEFLDLIDPQGEFLAGDPDI